MSIANHDASTIDDPEIAAMVRIAQLLAPFGMAARRRMLNWVEAVAKDAKALPCTAEQAEAKGQSDGE